MTTQDDYLTCAILCVSRAVVPASSGFPQAGQEGIHAVEQRGGVLAEFAGRGENGIGQRARLVGGVARAGHVDGDLAGAGGDLLDAARDLARRRSLLLDRGGDGGGDAADLPDGIADAADRRRRSRRWRTGSRVTCPAISSVAFAVWLARALTSEATTAKPLPASPARAASMVALSASRLVWLAIAPIRRSTSPIFSPAAVRLPTISVVFPALATAASATSLEWVTWRPISATEEASCSVAAATV